MVLTSAAASTQTTILPTARTSFSMAVHRALPAQFARVHRRFRTPTWSTVAMGLASIAFYVLLTRISGNVLSDSIASVGLGIAFYYGLTGFACVWYFRRQLRRSVRDFLSKGLLPGIGGLMLLYFFCYAAFDVYADPAYGFTSVDLPVVGRVGGVSVIGVGSLVLGLVLMVVQRLFDASWFHDPDVPRSAAEPGAAAEPDGAHISG
jgi:amino acid transporter